MKGKTTCNVITLVALAMLFFSCNGKSPRMPEPEVPKNPKEKQEPNKPTPEQPKPTPPTPNPPAPNPPAPNPPAPNPPAPNPPAPNPPAPNPPAPNPPAPNPPAPNPPVPNPPAPNPPAPNPPVPNPPVPNPPVPNPPVPNPPVPNPPVPNPPVPNPPVPNPPAPEPPKEKVLTVIGQWQQTSSATDYDVEKTWKTSTANLKTIYTFNKDGKYVLDLEFQGFPPQKAMGSYTFADGKLSVKIESGQSLGMQGAFEVKKVVWNTNGTPAEIWLKDLNGKKGYKLKSLNN